MYRDLRSDHCTARRQNPTDCSQADDKAGENHSPATRVRLLQATATREETALARQRMAIDGLRSEEHRTAEAEKSHEKFKSLHQELLQKLAVLQREETVTKPAYHEGASVL